MGSPFCSPIRRALLTSMITASYIVASSSLLSESGV